MLCSSTEFAPERGEAEAAAVALDHAAHALAGLLVAGQRIVEGALAVAEVDEGGDGGLSLLAEAPDRLGARVGRPVLRLAPRLERAQHMEARDLLLGMGFQVGRVIDPAEAGVPVGGEHGRAGLGDRGGRPAGGDTSAATARTRANKGIAGDSP